MGDHNRNLGRWGEKVAATHLESEGFAIVARNWRSPAGEIDIIARRNDRLHFVEVKTRRGRSHGPPDHAITPTKLNKLIQGAFYFLSETADEEVDWQIDLLAVELDRQNRLIRCEIVSNLTG